MSTGGDRKSRANKRHTKHLSKAPKRRTTKARRSLPKTIRVRSRKSTNSGMRGINISPDTVADESMSMESLIWLAKSRGVPFAGLTRSRLIKKINNYY